jgi:hypothetical protein
VFDLTIKSSSDAIARLTSCKDREGILTCRAGFAEPSTSAVDEIEELLGLEGVSSSSHAAFLCTGSP